MPAARNTDHKDQKTKEETKIKEQNTHLVKTNSENQHIDIQSSYAHMPKCWFENIQNIMVPSQHRYLKTLRPEYAKAAVKQDNGLKNTFINMIEVLKKGNKKIL